VSSAEVKERGELYFYSPSVSSPELKSKNVKLVLEQATKAQRGSGGIALPFL
jgi:hypothetical protein